MKNEQKKKTVSIAAADFNDDCDITVLLVDLNGSDLQPNTTREGVSLTLLHLAVLYMGQELTIKESERTYGTLTITGIE